MVTTMAISGIVTLLGAIIGAGIYWLGISTGMKIGKKNRD
jgi:hypothetical protein